MGPTKLSIQCSGFWVPEFISTVWEEFVKSISGLIISKSVIHEGPVRSQHVVKTEFINEKIESLKSFVIDHHLVTFYVAVSLPNNDSELSHHSVNCCLIEYEKNLLNIYLRFRSKLRIQWNSVSKLGYLKIFQVWGGWFPTEKLKLHLGATIFSSALEDSHTSAGIVILHNASNCLLNYILSSGVLEDSKQLTWSQ